MLGVIPPIFILLGLLDTWVPREKVVNHLGAGSGLRGLSLATAPVKPILYFWGDGCPACKEVAPVIDKLIAAKLPIEKFEVYNDRSNMDRLAMLFKMNGVPEQDWAIPVAFHNGKMYMGVPNILALAKELTPE